MTAAEPLPTREALIAAAADLIETRGFCAFSYADLEARIGIRKASIHHHFPTKADLGVAVIQATQDWATTTWADLERTHPRLPQRIRAMFDMKRAMAASCATGTGRICRVGALQAEYNALPEPVQQALAAFSERYIATLAGWLDQGRRDGDLVFPGQPRAMAQVMAAAIQAGLQRQRCNPEEPIDQVLDQLARLIGLR